MLESSTHILAMMIKTMKEALHRWNKDEIGNIFLRGEVLQSRIEFLQIKETDCYYQRGEMTLDLDNRICVMSCDFRSLCRGKSLT